MFVSDSYLNIAVAYWIKSSADDVVGGPVTEVYPETIKDAVEMLSSLREKYGDEFLAMHVYVRYGSWFVNMYVNATNEVDYDLKRGNYKGVPHYIINITSVHGVSMVCELLKVLDECSGDMEEFGNFLRMWLS